MSPIKRSRLVPTLWVLLGLSLPIALPAQTPGDGGEPTPPPPRLQALQLAQHPMPREQRMPELHRQMQSPMHERGEASPDAPRFSREQAMAARSYFDEQGHQGYAPSRPMRKDRERADTVRRWELGQSLPEGAVSYPLPRPLMLALGHPPEGYRYVRVGRDLLLVAESSGKVVDVIEDAAR